MSYDNNRFEAEEFAISEEYSGHKYKQGNNLALNTVILFLIYKV